MPKIYLGDTEKLKNHEFFLEKLNSISPERIKKIHKLKSVKNKQLCLLTGILINYSLRDLNLKSNVLYTKNGKPYFGDISDFHLNISHSGTKSIVAVSKNCIGCDIQENNNADLKIAHRFFTHTECDYIFNSLPLDTIFVKKRFFRIWVLKESYIKFTGDGLSKPLNKFEFIFKGNTIKVKENNLIQKCKFNEFKLDNYNIAICSSSPNTKSIKLIEVNL